MDLWRQNITETGEPEDHPIAVTMGIGIQHAAFSRDGRKLVYSQGRPVSNLWRVPILEDREVGWDDAEQLTFDQAYIEGVDVDPVGERRLYFSSDRGGNQNLWTLPMRGNDFIQLTNEPTPDRGPRVHRTEDESRSIPTEVEIATFGWCRLRAGLPHRLPTIPDRRWVHRGRLTVRTSRTTTLTTWEVIPMGSSCRSRAENGVES
jgi:hypothetical protein